MFAKTKDGNNADRYAYFIHDQRGALVQAVDKAGHVVWAAKYDAFGRATIISPAATEEIPTVELSLRLPGQVEDVETGLHYNWQRTYDPSTGRYLERDPAGLSGGINPYQYVSGNPTTLVDPTGEFGIAAPAARLVLGQVARTAAGVAAGAVGGAAVFVGSAVIVAGAAACWVSESCRKWVSNAWYGTTVPAANTPATTGEFCRIPPGYMNEHKDNPTGNGEGTNTGTSTSDPKAPPQPGEIPTLDWNDPTKPPIGPNGEEWVWRGKPPQGGDKGGYVNPSNPDQSAHPDLAHPAPVGPHWDYTDRNKDNPGWRVYPGGKIDKK
jgi:RHS repeat-associated protein